MTTTTDTGGKKMTVNQKLFRVNLVNYQTLHARAGYEVGSTLEEAQNKALATARKTDKNAYLSKSGTEVLFAGGMNC